MNTGAALLIDFGSTFTKLRAVDLTEARLIGGGQGPSTVDTDATIGMNAALADLEARIGGLPDFTYRLASSSAAGGLRMVTVGLVKELTAEAARQAALGAGAKLVGTFAYKLTDGDVAEIEALGPDIVLLAGGTDGGNEVVIDANAGRLAAARLSCPIIVAGNRVVAEDLRKRLEDSSKTAFVSENVMPEFNQLNIEPARAVIRRIFIERIVHAKGIDRAAVLFDRVLMPTPAAVLEGARHLAQGTGTQDGLGPLVVIDVGGATTDVHSIADGAPISEETVVHGLPEPHAKRTVEGDLGMRVNAATLAAAAGPEELARTAGLTAERFGEVISAFGADLGRLPGDDGEKAVDAALARAAVNLAVRRHAGRMRIVHTVNGSLCVQEGKDLSRVAMVIGTGGVLAHGEAPHLALAAALADADDPASLRPKGARIALDADYLLFAVGLLAEVAPEAALAIGVRSLEKIKEGRHGIGSAA